MLRMSFFPAAINKGTIYDDLVGNVDFASTWLNYAGTSIPSYMQGISFRLLLSPSKSNTS
jgi:hypothetical protein